MHADDLSPLAAAAAQRHELTRAKAIQALRELDRAGAPATFTAVAEAAGISRSWLYTQPASRPPTPRCAAGSPQHSSATRRLPTKTTGSAASSPARSATSAHPGSDPVTIQPSKTPRQPLRHRVKDTVRDAMAQVTAPADTKAQDNVRRGHPDLPRP